MTTMLSRTKLAMLFSIAILASLYAAGDSATYMSWRAKAAASPASAEKGTLGMVGPRDAVTVWNRKAAQLVVLPPPAPAIAPVRQGRIMTIMQVAVHDAVNGITGEYATYLSPGPAPQGAAPEAAAIAAGHRVLTTLFSDQTGDLDNLFQMTLADHGLSDMDPGVGYGRAAADAILTLRSTDGAGSEAACAYNPPFPGTPGTYMPIGSQVPLLPCWGSVRPWVMRSGSQFRPEGPPALTSEQYARDYNEVKEIGALNGSSRTPLQTSIATFWRASPVTIWNQVMDRVAEGHGLNISATARAYALVYLAASDSSIACWDAKYYYNFWRPQAAIRNGHLDGNDQTNADPTWTPLFTTPAHPDYTSGHASNSGAMAGVMALVFGDEPGMTLISTVDSITREWSSFREGVNEVIDARVYSGIHFRTADVVGARTGKQTARYTLTHALQQCGKGNAKCD